MRRSNGSPRGWPSRRTAKAEPQTGRRQGLESRALSNEPLPALSGVGIVTSDAGKASGWAAETEMGLRCSKPSGAEREAGRSLPRSGRALGKSSFLTRTQTHKSLDKIASDPGKQYGKRRKEGRLLSGFLSETASLRYHSHIQLTHSKWSSTLFFRVIHWVVQPSSDFNSRIFCSLPNYTLARVAWLVGHRPADQRVAGLIPSQGTRLGCGFGPPLGHVPEATGWRLSLTLMFCSLSFSPSATLFGINKRKKKF